MVQNLLRRHYLFSVWNKCQTFQKHIFCIEKQLVSCNAWPHWLIKKRIELIFIEKISILIPDTQLDRTERINSLCENCRSVISILSRIETTQ